MLFCFLFAFDGKPFSKFKPLCAPFGLEGNFLGRRPKPALLFLIAEKEGKKASTPGSHKIYFYTGILQLPTVGQVKCLYNSVKNKFYRRLQRGALNGNNTAKAMRKKHLIFAIRASTRVSVGSMIFQI